MGVVLVSIAVTVKQRARIIYSPNALIENAILGNFFIFIAYLLIFKGSLRTAKKLPKIPKRVFIYLSWILFFVIYALYKKEFLVALDIFIYGSLISIVIADIEILYTTFKKNKTHFVIPLIIFALSLIIDFTLKSIVEIWHITNPQTIESISFLIRLLALFALLYAGKGVVLKRSERMKIPMIHDTTLKFLRKIVISVIVFSISFSFFTFMSIYALDYMIRGALKDYTQSISIDASQTATNIQSLLLIKTRGELEKLAVNPDIIKLNETGKETLKNYYISHKGNISSVARMDKHGIIIYTYPFTKSIGKDISSQPHIKKLLKTDTPILSDPIMSVQGFPAIVLHVPLFENGVFNGSVAALFDLRKIQQFANKKYKDERLVMANSLGTIILAPDESMLFKNISTVFPMKENDTFTTCRFGNGLVIKKSFIPIHGKVYTIYVFVPKSDVFRAVLFERLMLLLLGGSFLLFFLYATKSFYSAFQEESKGLKEFAEMEYEESKTLSLRLSKLVSLFSNVDINKNLNETSKYILESALKIIDKGNAGSVLIKNGDKFVFVAVEGYPKTLEGKTLDKNEMVPAISKKPFIIKNIYDESIKTADKNYSPETKDLLRKSGTKNIKFTIEAPLIANGEYYGGIFIDSFLSEDTFSEDDLKIAEAISKLASIFVKSKLLFNSLQEAESRLFYLTDSFSGLDISLEEEEFFKNILEMGKKLIPQADAGSVTLRKGNFYKYMAIFGYNEILKNLKLRVNTSYNAKFRKAEIIRNIVSFNKGHFTPEEIEIFSKGNGFKIQQSIVAPVIVNGEYMGGIFLDSFKKGEIFTDKDLRVATALSKLASMFVGGILSYQKLKKADTFNEASITLLHRTKIELAKEDMLKIAYNILHSIYAGELQEVAVWERGKSKMILTKYDGKNIYSLPLNVKSLKNTIQKKGSFFIEKNKKGIQSAQAIVYSGFSSVPVFRVRFTGTHTFEEDEKKFIDRFGGEVVTLYQSVSYNSQLKDTLTNYIFSIANVTRSYDPYTEGHSIRVAYLAMRIGEKLSLGAEEKAKLLLSATLHDVGKVGVSRNILLKPGKLTKEEFEMIKQHSVEGEKIVSPIDPTAAKIIRHHHEKWNGAGYPDGLNDGQIPLLSRIITVADIFDSLTTDRPYRKAFGFDKAMEIMIEERGKTFDPNIFDAFLTLQKGILMKKEITEKDMDKMQQIIVEGYR